MIADDRKDARKEARKTADGDAAGAKWSFDRKEIASDWMDSSHVTWFNSLFDDFKGAIDRRDFVGKEAREAFLCVQLITHRLRVGARGVPRAAARRSELDRGARPQRHDRAAHRRSLKTCKTSTSRSECGGSRR